MPRAKTETKFSLYLREQDQQRIIFYQNLIYKSLNVELSVSKIISKLINEAKSIDQLIYEAMGKTLDTKPTEQKEA